MRPFLRWAGGKRWLASNGRINLPTQSTYVEPFLGGGAIFFAQNADSALLSDLNPYLINAYQWMKASPSELFELCTNHFKKHSNDHFYKVRGSLGRQTIDDAAAFIYLNRSCFNGLFRVNLAGNFNVPVGTKLFELTSASEFANWSKHLSTAEISCVDFEQTVDRCGRGDFLFVDPPYTVRHNANGFIEYNEKIPSWDDQVRLASSLKRAKKRGAAFLLTNADHDSVRALYQADHILLSLERGSEMAGKTASRGRTTELIVASGPDVLSSGRLF